MRSDKEEVFKLRSLGKSYNEIKSLHGISKSTLSEWLAKSDWSERIKIDLAKQASIKGAITLRSLNKIRGENLSKIYAEARAEARQEFEYFKFHPLFIAGIVIHWGEGDKTSRHAIRVANTDPLMIQSFVRFLLEICGLPKEKLRASILLYPDLNPEACKDFWVEQSTLPKENFHKSIVIQGRHKTRRVRYGVCSIIVSSTYLKEKIRIWLDLLAKELINANYLSRE